MPTYDAVVVGAGHNGLICATYLARAGLDVLVCERSDRIGGACVTEELFTGFLMSSAAYSLSLLQPTIVTELGLRLDVRAKDPHLFAPLPDGGGVLVWDDPERRAGSIAEVSKGDADAYEEFSALFDEAARRLRPMLSYPATRRQVRRAFRKSDVEDLFDKTVEGSIADACEEYFESDAMQGLMASQGITGSAGGPKTPGTAYNFLHHSMGEAAGPLGTWGYVRGGMGAITQELARVLRESGSEIRLEAEVQGIKVGERRKASGVVLADEEVDAPIVCSNADPKTTISLVERDLLPVEFVEDVELLPTEGTVVKVNCALSGLPRFRGMSAEGEVGPEHLGTIVVAPSIDHLEKACRQAAEGRVPDEFFCEAWIQTATEPELAPEGRHTLSVFAQYAPYTLSEGTWDERRDEIGDGVLAALERYAPGLTDLVDDRLVLGPPDIEDRFGMTGGHIFHGEHLPEWIFERRPAFGWHRHRLPLPGVYLCGAGAHPGGGVCGAPGRNAARAVLEDLVAGG